jgi:hypothetical protein
VMPVPDSHCFATRTQAARRISGTLTTSAI